MRLILHAPNVHQGGGRTLLVQLLRAIAAVPCLALLDSRLAADIPPAIRVRRIPATLFHRIAAERHLRNIARPDDVVLCFGNLPPLFSLPSKIVVFLQNRYLVDPTVALRTFPKKAAIRIWLERRWLFSRRRRAHLFIVQSESMRVAVHEHCGVEALVLPFAGAGPTPEELASKRTHPVDYDFLYVASGEPHKNHRKLVEAWAMLAADNVRPHLCLTLSRDSHPALCAWIDQQTVTHGLKITNLTEVGAKEVASLYQRSLALVYPSTAESFGLPLFEAVQAGLPVLAAERDYVRDLVDPTETFDPASSRSIARAVRRFLKLPESRPEIVDASVFVRQLLSDSCAL